MTYNEWTNYHGEPSALMGWDVPKPFDWGPASMGAYILLVYGERELFSDDVREVNAAFTRAACIVRATLWPEVEAWASLYNGLSAPYKEIVAQSVRVAPNGVGQALLDAYNDGGAYSERTVSAQDVTERLRFMADVVSPFERVLEAFAPLFVEGVRLCV